MDALIEGVEAAEDVEGVATEGVADATDPSIPGPEAGPETGTTFEILRASIFQTWFPFDFCFLPSSLKREIYRCFQR